MLDSLVIAYLFLGGMGAGACLVLGVLVFFTPRANISSTAGAFLPGLAYRRFYSSAYTIACGALILGAICLLASMNRPDAILVLLASPTFSVVSVGAYALAALILASAILVLAWQRAIQVPLWFVRLVSGVAIVLAIIVMIYTAVLLRLFRHVPFFQTNWICALFICSSLSTGIASIVLSTHAFQLFLQFQTVIKRLLTIDAVIVIGEIAALVAFMTSRLHLAAEPTMRLLSGDLALPFWAGLVGAGLVVPLALNIASKQVTNINVWPGLISILILVGGFLLRWCIVVAP